MSEARAQTAEIAAVPELEAGRRVALREAWTAFWASRMIVWVAGIAALAAFGWPSDDSARLDPLYLTNPFQGTFENVLAAPAARFDSAWYLAIAEHGYEVSGRAAFFPLFPALVAAGGSLLGSGLVAGILISGALGIGSLYLVHRLVALDFDAVDARNTVWLMAFFPSAVVLSAVYTESLFLVLSLGAIYCGRLGRWPAAGALGALAAASRSTGVLIALALLALYLYGPRADRPRGGLGGWRPRHHVRPDVLWIGLVPLGVVGYLAYLGATTGDPLAAFAAQSHWDRLFVPLGGIAMGAWSAVLGAIELLPGLGASQAGAGQLSTLIALRDLALFGALLLALWLLSRSWRLLPPAYTVYAVSGLALPLSMPSTDEALLSLPRFMLVLFPLWIALALWVRERDALRPVLGAMAALLAVWSGLFTTWTWAP